MAIQRLREQLQIPDGVRVILAAGRLSFEKGYVDLIEALALLARSISGAEWKLLLAGTGPEKERLLQAIGRHQLEQSVGLVGHQPNLREMYALAGIVALPSHSEGSPNVLLEAMAAGLPIAA